MKATDPKSQLLLALAHLGPLSEAALWRKSARSNGHGQLEESHA